MLLAKETYHSRYDLNEILVRDINININIDSTNDSTNDRSIGSSIEREQRAR